MHYPDNNDYMGLYTITQVSVHLENSLKDIFSSFKDRKKYPSIKDIKVYYFSDGDISNNKKNHYMHY